MSLISFAPDDDTSTKRSMRAPALLAVLATAALALGCDANANPPNPAEVRHEAAAATETVAGDVKGAALGVREGLQNALKGPAYNPVNINTASRLQLMALPGLSSIQARQIIAHRPYKKADDLLARHVLAQDEYDRIEPSIVTD